MPENDNPLSDSGRFLIDREALMAVIDQRVRSGIEIWWDRYQLPLHNQNVKKIEGMTSALDRMKGAMWIIGILWIIVTAAIQLKK